MFIVTAAGETIKVDDDYELKEGEQLADDQDDDDDQGGEGNDDQGDNDDEGDDDQDDDQEGDEDGEDDEDVITIGEEAPPPEEELEGAPAWVKKLREQHREQQRLIKSLQKRVADAEKPVTPQVTDPGPKPKLEDFDYDSAKWEAAYDEWKAKEQRSKDAKREVAEQQQAQDQAWQAQLDEYATEKTKLKVKDFDDAETVVKDTLTPVQQAIIIQGAKNKALVIYALGKNEAKVQELAKITDPVKFAFAVANLEKEIKVKPGKKAPPAPERRISGTGSKAGAVDSTLEKLRAEAEQTGDYTKVTKYRRDRKAKASRQRN